MTCCHAAILRRPSGQLVCMQCGVKVSSHEMPRGIQVRDAYDSYWQTPKKDPAMVKA